MITHLIKIILSSAIVAGAYYSYINFNFTEAAKYIDEIKNAFAQEECYIQDALQSGGDSIQECKPKHIEESSYFVSGSLFQSAVWSGNNLTINNHTDDIKYIIEESKNLIVIGGDNKKYEFEIESYELLDNYTLIRIDKNSLDYNFNELYLVGILAGTK